MSATREYRFRTFVELAFTVEVDTEGFSPSASEFEAKVAAEHKAGSLVEALDTIFRVVGNTYEMRVTDMTEIDEDDDSV